MRISSKKQFATLIVALALTTIVFIPRAEAVSASLVLAPSSGPAGTVSTATGNGFSNSTCGVNLFFDSPTGRLLSFAPAVNGSFSASMIIPTNATQGQHAILAEGLLFTIEFCDAPSGEEARAIFTVTIAVQRPDVGRPTSFAVLNIDLRKLPVVAPWKPGDPIVDPPGEHPPGGEGTDFSTTSRSQPSIEPVVSTVQTASISPPDPPLPSPLVSFDGILTGASAFDAVGDVGPHHYIHARNFQFAVYDKQGNLLAGPSNINSLWIAAGTNDACQRNNNGDPDVKYDPLADRWLLSQFVAFSNQCIAVSQTADPITGGWFLYNYQGTPTFPWVTNDYPKFGVWPDAYYMGSNAGYPIGHAWAFNRAKMLSGDSTAEVVRFPAGGAFMLPSDVDGPPPPNGSTNVFLRFVDGAEFGGADRLQLSEFHADWTDPDGPGPLLPGSLSTFTALPDLATDPFDSNLCGFGMRPSCVPQLGTSQLLDTLRGEPMYRLQYRNFGGYETLVVNHSVDVDGADRTGVRWYELRKVGGVWSIHQQETFSPDTTHRWMGSMAMNGNGDIGMGYSTSSSSIYPTITYTGRLSSDPLNTMSAGEVNALPGGGSQSSRRWGDYSALSVDPTDDCTFWFTTGYVPFTGAPPATHIIAFRLGACVKVQKFFTDTSLNPLPTDSSGRAKVDVVLSRGIVRSTNPGEIMAWVNITNEGPSSLDSLKAMETLPVDWAITPAWIPGHGSIHVLYQTGLSLANNLDIADPTSISTTTGNPQTVSLAIPSISATAIGHPLQPGQTILLQVKLDYSLVKTAQSAASYPRNYADTAAASVWTMPNYVGMFATDSTSDFFIAYAKVVG